METQNDADNAARTLVQQPSRKVRPAEVEHRVHDAIDLASGSIHTVPMKGLPSAKTRVRRLADVGFPADASMFTGRRYRLTPQRPFRAKPESWIDADFSTSVPINNPSFFFNFSAGTGAEWMWWRVPPSFPNFWATCNLSFSGLPEGPAMMSLSVEVVPHVGATGKIVIFIGGQIVEIEITEPVARTIDIGFVHDGDPVMTAMVLLRQGIFDFLFRSATLRHAHR